MLEPPTPATWRIALPRGATAVPIARAMVRTAMQDLRVTADRTTAQLLTAELVTNVLKHTCGADPIELVVEQRPTGCRIEVHDDSPLLVEGLGDPVPLGEPGAGVAGAPGGGAPDGPGVDPPGGISAGPSAGPSPGRSSDGEVPTQRAEEEAGRSADGAETGDGGEGQELDGEGQGPDEDNGHAGVDGDTYADGSPDSRSADDDDADATAAHGTDTGPDALSPGPARGDHDGRGLLLIRSLSTASGCRPTPRGKAVWFTLPGVRRPRRR